MDSTIYQIFVRCGHGSCGGGEAGIERERERTGDKYHQPTKTCTALDSELCPKFAVKLRA